MTTPLLSVSLDDCPPPAGGDARHNDGCLGPLQLIQLEWSFRQWVRITNHYETRQARRGILLVFLLIRYTGAALDEVLGLDLQADFVDRSVIFRQSGAAGCPGREVRLVPHLAREIQETREGHDLGEMLLDFQSLEPWMVRREFTDRAEACGFPGELGSPENIGLARSVELLGGNAPPEGIEPSLGSSMPLLSCNPKPTAVRRQHSAARPSLSRPRVGANTAQNRFAGTIVDMRRDGLQSQVHLLTTGGHSLTAMVTNNSAERLGLQSGRMAAVEIEAHSVSLHVRNNYAFSSADNCFSGEIIGLTRGRVSWEVVVDIGAGIKICSLLSAHYGATLKLKLGKTAWVAFNGFNVILHAN